MTADDVGVAQYQMYSYAHRFLKLLLRGLKSALSKALYSLLKATRVSWRLKSIALGHQEFNQPETRFQLQGGQMNQKIEIFCLSLYPHQTLKRTVLNEIWGKIFFPSLYRKIKEQNPSISKGLTKTFLKFSARWTGDYVTSMLVFRAEKRSAQASENRSSHR